MTIYELIFQIYQPVYPMLYRKVREILKKEVSRFNRDVMVLDVGGRRSPYTIGIGAKVTISDLPRRTAKQSQLELGTSKEIISLLRKRRSNIRLLIYDDMTRTCFKENTFDIIVSTEVLEHVEEDETFIKNVHKILRKGGLFLMTTPHGEYVKNTNPDHKRHYTNFQLKGLLSKYFDSVETWGDVRGGRFHRWGIIGGAWSLRHPYWTIRGMIGNALNYYQPLPKTPRKGEPQNLFGVGGKGRIVSKKAFSI